MMIFAILLIITIHRSMSPFTKTCLSLVSLAALTLCSSCAEDDSAAQSIELKSHSKTPVLAKIKMSGVEAFSLVSSDDTLANSPAYVFGGSADGIGLLKEGDNYIIVVNNEDNYSVSQLLLDKTFKPTQGKYLLNSDGGKYRL